MPLHQHLSKLTPLRARNQPRHLSQKLPCPPRSTHRQPVARLSRSLTTQVRLRLASSLSTPSPLHPQGHPPLLVSLAFLTGRKCQAPKKDAMICVHHISHPRRAPATAAPLPPATAHPAHPSSELWSKTLSAWQGWAGRARVGIIHGTTRWRGRGGERAGSEAREARENCGM